MRIRLGDECAVFEGAYLTGPGTLVMGDRSSIGVHTAIACRERIEIGRDTMIAGHCFILDLDHDFHNLGVPVREQGLDIRPVRSGNDVWIGTHRVLLRGVTRDVPPYTIAAGAPARVMRERGSGGRIKEIPDSTAGAAGVGDRSATPVQ